MVSRALRVAGAVVTVAVWVPCIAIAIALELRHLRRHGDLSWES